MPNSFASSLRLIRTRPVFAAAVVITLAIAIGATAAVYGIIDKLLIRALPFPDADRIAFVDNAWPLFADVNGEPAPDPNDGLARLARYEVGRVSVGAGEQRLARVARVGGEYFAILGVSPAAGSVLGPEDVRDARQHVVLSDALADQIFGDSDAALGRTITVNGQSHVVTGVMPRSFAFYVRGMVIDAWVPFTENADFFSAAQGEGGGTIARLQPGITFVEAQSRTDLVFDRIARARPEFRLREDDRMRLVALRDHWYGPLRGPLLMLFGAAGCFLVIACANVTGLMLARAAERQRASAIRTVLGASTGQLVRESLAESLVLAILACTAGILVADWGARALLALSPVPVPHADGIGVTLRMIAVAFALAVAAACIAGVITAWRTSRGDPLRGLTTGPRDATFVATRTRHGLVVAQLAITVMLLVNGGLLLRSFRALRFESTGFESRNVFTLEIAAVGPRFSDARSRLAYYDRILDTLTAVPGVQHAGMVNFLPMYSGTLMVPVTIPDLAEGDRSPTWSYRVATPDYFRAMRIPLLAGREFTDSDDEDAPRVAILDRSTAAMLGTAPHDVIGRRIVLTLGEPATYAIVGVVGDVRQQGLGIRLYPGFYLSANQRVPTVMNLVARVTADPATAATALRGALRAVDASLPVGALYPLDARVSDTVSRRRFAVVLSAVLGVCALVLSIVALFALMSQVVVHRLHEIGVRVAMGARPWDVLGLVLRQGGGMAAIGIAGGLAAAMATSRLIAGMLYGIGVSDPATFAGVTSLVLLVAIVACAVPATRAAKANPVDVLRRE